MKKVLLLVCLVGCAAPAQQTIPQKAESAQAPAVERGEVSALTSAVTASVERRSEAAKFWRSAAERQEVLVRDTSSYIVTTMKVEAPEGANILLEPDGEVYALMVMEPGRTVEFEFIIEITETGQLISRQGFSAVIQGGSNTDILVNIPFGAGAFIGAGQVRHLRMSIRAVKLDVPVKVSFLPLRVQALLQRIEPVRDRVY